MNRTTHWQNVYSTKQADEVSWFESAPDISMGFIRQTGSKKDAAVIDVGAGTSQLVDTLLGEGYSDITCVDISSQALQISQQRLGDLGKSVDWITADVTQLTLNKKFYLWHDRAVFHFLTEAKDREKYIEVLNESLLTGGHVVIATFAEKGPVKCSGLDVVRYTPTKLQDELGTGYALQSSAVHSHQTPWQSEQLFCYCHFIKR